MRDIQLPRIFGLIVMTSFALAAPSSIQQDNGLQQRVAPLEAQTASLAEQLAALGQTKIVNVDCAAGERIQTAVNAARNPTALVIFVFGLCSENVTVTRNQVTLIRAGAAGAGIVAADANRPVVSSATFPVRFVLTGLAISGGRVGVLVDFGSQAEVIDCTVRNNGTAVEVQQAGVVHLSNSVLENNTGNGVSAAGGAHVLMSGGAVRNNASDGLVFGGSTAKIGGSAIIASNGAYGIWLQAGLVAHSQ